jgi:hypothetical protein
MGTAVANQWFQQFGILELTIAGASDATSDVNMELLPRRH